MKKLFLDIFLCRATNALIVPGVIFWIIVGVSFLIMLITSLWFWGDAWFAFVYNWDWTHGYGNWTHRDPFPSAHPIEQPPH